MLKLRIFACKQNLASIKSLYCINFFSVLDLYPTSPFSFPLICVPFVPSVLVDMKLLEYAPTLLLIFRTCKLSSVREYIHSF